MEKDYLKNVVNKIKAVDTPPFMFTRIEAKIQDLNESKVPLKWSVIAGFAFTLLFVFNFYSLNNSDLESNISSSVAQSMNINLSNQLYND